MNCSEFQQRLDEAIDAHEPDAEEQAALAQHLETCPGENCRTLWQQAGLLAQAVRCWREELAEVDLTERVLAQLHALDSAQRARDAVPPLQPRYALVREPAAARDRGVAPRIDRGVWVSLATLSAALLLVLSVLTLSGPQPRDVASSSGLASQKIVAVHPARPHTAPAATVAEPAGRLAGSYASMPLTATQFLTDAVVLVVPADLSDPEEEPSRADLWADRLGKRWEPIGRELTSALEALIEAVPQSESAS